MTDHTEQTDDKGKMTTGVEKSPSEQKSELKEKDLDKVTGGLNPQPLPPDKLPPDLT
jgi:hypothetical protein